MVAIRGGICGPDPGEVDGAYLNEIETDRSAFWFALGAQNSVLNGFTYAGVAGLMALDILPGAALASERDAGGNEQDRGYFLWSDTTVRVTFDPASVGARNDAVVLAFIDIEDGAVGSGALSVGPQIVSVPGTSGVTTAVTNANITAYLGRGGWVRLLNVPILPAATEIATGTISEAAIQLRGWNTITGLTNSTGFTVSEALYRVSPDGMVTVSITATRTGADMVASPAGNITDAPIFTGLPSDLRPTVHRYLNLDIHSTYTFRGHISSAGVLSFSHFGASGLTLSTGAVFRANGSYYL